tara:strand:- start:200 stop:1522 length:1323 start_codon:yes stop_codon:yes gene_type:complete
MSKSAALCLAALALYFAPSALAQDDSEVYRIGSSGAESVDLSKFKIDTSMPAYPATALLSGSNVEVENFSTSEDFGLRFVNLFSPEGKLKPGFAYGATPYWWFNRNISSDLYRKHYSTRIFARTQLSLAAISLPGSETNTDSDGLSVGLGLVTEFLDSADPRFDEDTKECVAAAYQKFDTTVDVNRVAVDQTIDELMAENNLTLQTKNPAAVIAALAALGDHGETYWWGRYDEKLEANRKKARESEDENAVAAASELQAYLDCGTAAEKRAVEKSSLKLGLALRADSESGELDGLQTMGSSVWLSYRNPIRFDALTSSNLFVRYDLDRSEVVPENEVMPGDMGAKESRRYDSLQAGVGLARVGDNSKVASTLAYVSKNYDTAELEDSNYLLATLGASYKVSDGVWLEFSLGWSDDDKFDNDRFTRLELKVDWGRFFGTST